MGLPKPAEENIQLTDEDLRRTEDMQKLTSKIDKLIEEQENEIINFYKHFQSFEMWLKQNSGDLDKFRSMLLDKIGYMRLHIQKTVSLLSNILLMTQSEQKLDSKKLMIKDQIAKDFDAEENFAKQLKYPKDIVKLAQHITKDFAKMLSETKEDIKIESKTEELIENILHMIGRIQERLGLIEKFALSENIQGASERIHELVEDINREKLAFDRLSQFEKVHLHLLLTLYDQEKDTLAKESLYADDTKKLSPEGPSDIIE